MGRATRASSKRQFGGKVARLTGLEPATPGVTGRYSNQLSYNRIEGRLGNRHGGVNGRKAGFRTKPALCRSR